MTWSSFPGPYTRIRVSCYQRLVVVSLHTGQRYGDLQQVKDEVSDSALTMLQDGVPRDIKVGGSDEGTIRYVPQVTRIGWKRSRDTRKNAWKKVPHGVDLFRLLPGFAQLRFDTTLEI